MYLRAFANKVFAPAATSYWELLLITSAILRIEVPGVVVECGCFKGGSAATLSLACRRAKRRLHVFDSFSGLPEPSTEDASHRILSDSEIHKYRKGAFAGSLETVKRNISKHGAIECCQFWPGYFEETMPEFKDRVAVAFLDVDLVDSLRTCIKSLWPLMPDGALLFTHEAHHLEVAKLFHHDEWWRQNVGQDAPGLVGAGSGLGLGLWKNRHGYYGSCLGLVRKNPVVTKVCDEGERAESRRTANGFRFQAVGSK